MLSFSEAIFPLARCRAGLKITQERVLQVMPRFLRPALFSCRLPATVSQTSLVVPLPEYELPHTFPGFRLCYIPSGGILMLRMSRHVLTSEFLYQHKKNPSDALKMVGVTHQTECIVTTNQLSVCLLMEPPPSSAIRTKCKGIISFHYFQWLVEMLLVTHLESGFLYRFCFQSANYQQVKQNCFLITTELITLH